MCHASGANGGGAVITILDLKAELAKLTMLRGRTPTTARAEREGSSSQLAPYRDGAIFASKSAGAGAWERHPDGDELVQVIVRLDIDDPRRRNRNAIRRGEQP
jgi:hypothetical protein